MAASNLVNVDVSVETFNEITNALEASGVKVNPDNPITLTKNIKIKGPIDYRQVTIRKDVMDIASRVYEPPMAADADGHTYFLTDSLHFINFLDDVYKYIFKGEKPQATPTTEVTTKPKSSW